MASNGKTCGLTVDEMMERYPKRQVERAMFQPNYAEGRQQSIRTFEEQIEAGLHVESCKVGLAKILNTPPGPPIDPAEPADLNPDVQWRMRILKRLRGLYPEGDDPQRVNIEAILTAYRSRQLTRYADVATVWYAGHLIAGPMSRTDLNIDSFLDRFDEWEAKYGPGRICVEEQSVNYAVSKLNKAVIPPCNGSSHHVFTILVRLVGVTAFTRISHVLDDTGSSYLELFEDDDCQRLGLTPNYHDTMLGITLDTANGTVTRPSIRVEVQLEVNGNPIGPVRSVIAVISPGAGDTQLRCSGMHLRQVLFTGTSPDGQGNLYISDRKTGIVELLPRV